jgi:hypothetical protein
MIKVREVRIISKNSFGKHEYSTGIQSIHSCLIIYVFYNKLYKNIFSYYVFKLIMFLNVTVRKYVTMIMYCTSQQSIVCMFKMKNVKAILMGKLPIL